MAGSFCMVRNATPNPIGLPVPFGGILVPGQAIVINDSLANVVAALGSPVNSGLTFTALPDNYAGSVAGNAFVGNVSRQRLGPFTRENIAASLTDSAMQTALDGAASYTSQLVEKAGSIVGIWLLLSGAAAGAAITVAASVNGVTTVISAQSIAIAGLQVVATILPNRVPFAAGDKLGMMLTTPVGWTATTVDAIGGLIIQD